jgi:hypothetical protein
MITAYARAFAEKAKFIAELALNKSDFLSTTPKWPSHHNRLHVLDLV